MQSNNTPSDKRVDYTYDESTGTLSIVLNGTFDSIKFDDKGVMHVTDEDAAFTYNGQVVPNPAPTPEASKPELSLAELRAKQERMRKSKMAESAQYHEDPNNPWSVANDHLPWQARVAMDRATQYSARKAEEYRSSHAAALPSQQTHDLQNLSGVIVFLAFLMIFAFVMLWALL